MKKTEDNGAMSSGTIRAVDGRHEDVEHSKRARIEEEKGEIPIPPAAVEDDAEEDGGELGDEDLDIEDGQIQKREREEDREEPPARRARLCHIVIDMHALEEDDDGLTNDGNNLDVEKLKYFLESKHEGHVISAYKLMKAKLDEVERFIKLHVYELVDKEVMQNDPEAI